MSGRQPLQVASVVIDEGLHLVMMPRYDVLSCRGQRRLRQQQARHLWGRQVRRQVRGLVATTPIHGPHWCEASQRNALARFHDLRGSSPRALSTDRSSSRNSVISCRTCHYCASPAPSTRYSGAVATIQVRDVPDEVAEIYRRRAQASGKSLQSYMREQLIAMARRRDKAEVMAIVEQALEHDPASGLSADTIRAGLRELRGE